MPEQILSQIHAVYLCMKCSKELKQFCFVTDDKHNRKKHLETNGLIRTVKWKVPEDLDLDPDSPANLWQAI